MIGICPSKCKNTKPRIVLYQIRWSMHSIEMVTSENIGMYSLDGYDPYWNGFTEPIWTW